MSEEKQPKTVGEYTSQQIARLAAKGTRWPHKLTPAEVQAVCASALTQRPDRIRKPQRHTVVIELDGRPWRITHSPEEY